MAQHSPGPWSIDDNDLRDDAQMVLSDQTGCPIAEAFLQARGGECEANARLIAAAPKLRAALAEALPLLVIYLRGVLNGVGKLVARIEALEAALAPFAKAGSIAGERSPYGDWYAYRPAAGDEYAICGDHLRAAYAALTPEAPHAD